MAQASQQVIWTCLPNGVTDDGDLKISVLVSPRLKLFGGRPALSQFSDWLDWPKTAFRDVGVFEINGDKHEGRRVSQPDSDVWKALFPETTYVQSRVFEDFSDRTILSYPIADLAQAINSLYQRLATEAEDELPTAGSFAPLARPMQKPKDQRTVLNDVRKGGVSAAARDLADTLDLLSAYHQPLERSELHHYENQGPDDPQPSSNWRSQRLTALPAPEDFQTLIDFHQVVSALNQHPMLLRASGLVMDFVIPARDVPTSGEIRFVPEWKADETVETLPDETPVTVFEQVDGGFTARARDPSESQIFGNWLRLTPKVFDVVQMDVDGAGLKVRNFFQSVWRVQDERTADESFGKEDTQPHRTGAPTLRSGGLTLAQRRRDRAVKTQFTAAATLQASHVAGSTLKLFAEDLTRGYRADVLDERAGTWQSLCRRDGVYTLVNSGVVMRSADEEGVIRLAATQSSDGENADIMKIHEGLFVWRGWSLTAPLPMPALGIDDEVAEPDNAAPDGLPLETDFFVRGGSLPSLRFGRTYQMRLRLVDLAGNSLPFDPKLKVPDEVLSERETYLRYEPVEAPALALVDAPDEFPTDGESMGRLAIRTFNDPHDAVVTATPPRVRRHLLAPRVTHNFAELNGALDTDEGTVNPALFTLLSQRDVALQTITLRTPAWSPGGPLADRVETPYAVAPEDYSLTYLPDPLARGVAIRVFGLAHVDPTKVFGIDLYPDDAQWPDAAPFKIGIEEGQRQPGFDDAIRLFNVPLMRAERARLRISCVVGGRDLALMAIWRLIEAEGLDGAALEGLRRRAREGQHWMLTPWREIDLVHAVQKPLVRPDMNGFSGLAAPSAGRELGRTPARVSFETPLHAKSTARLDMIGTWHEPRDTAAAGAESQEREATAQSWTLSRLATPDETWAQRQAMHTFADTRYRRVFYRLEATTRFREYMPPPIRNDPGGAALKVVSDPTRVWIPNAAPPPPPQVRYVIPTFGWSRSGAGDERRSWRRGGGLRIYMDRPWFGSGHGELLGVLLPPSDATNTTIDGPLKAHVTQWGADPIWLGGRVETAAPRLGAFPRRVTGGAVAYPGAAQIFQDEGADLPDSFPVQGLTVPGLAQELRVDVAPHQVGYDADRKLWYCDVVIQPGDAYFPFIRLALARYHPVSVNGAHLSQVVLAEFQQLAPDRYLSITRNGNKLNLTLHGYTGGSLTLGGLKSGQVEAELQELALGADEGLDWRKVTPPPELQPVPSGSFGVGEVVLLRVSDAPRSTPRNAAERALALEAARLSEAGAFADLVIRPDLVRWLLPPILWQAEVRLPADHAMRRMRVLVTERERHPSGDRNAAGEIPLADRIVYAEAVEV